MPSNEYAKPSFVCEHGCGCRIDTVSWDTLNELRSNQTYPDALSDDMLIMLHSHVPLDDFKVYEVVGDLALVVNYDFWVVSNGTLRNK